MVKTLHFQFRVCEFHPGWKTKIPHAVWHGNPPPPPPKKKNKNTNKQTKTDVSCVAITYLQFIQGCKTDPIESGNSE